MEPYAYPLLVVAGFVAGFVNTLAGSGSLVTLPALIFLGLPPTVANGTNRLAILLQNVVAVSRYKSFGMLELRHGAWLALPALLGALLGARLAVDLDETLLRRTIGALFLLMVPILAARPQRWLAGARPDRAQAAATAREPKVWLALFLVGMYGGFLQAGVGIFLLVVLVLGAGFDVVRANAVKVLIILLFTAAALAVFVVHGQVAWGPGLVLASGNMLGALAATQVARHRGAEFVHWFLLVVVTVSGLWLLGSWLG